MNHKISGYGWLMIACGFLTLLVTNGMTLTGITVFDNLLLAEFGWQRGALKLRDLITFAGAGLVAPLFGYYADKGHIKNCILLGCGFLAAGFITYSRINSLAGLYLAHALFGLSLASAGIVSVVFLVSKHVPASRRGLALGLALVGSSFGNTVFPQFNLSLLKVMDWRSAFLALSVVPALLSICVVATVRRSSINQDAGRSATSGLSAHGSGEATPFASEAGLGVILKKKSFWMIGAVAMLTFFAILGVSTHLFLRLTGAGYSAQFAGNTLGLLFLTGLAGKLFSGFLADRFGDRRVMSLSLLLMILGAAGLSRFADTNVQASVVAFGLGWGALYTLIQVSVISEFGTAGAGRVLGCIAFLEALGGGLGPWIVGLAFDQSGSYALPFALIASLLSVAAILNLFRRQLPESAKVIPEAKPV
jgi:MFS family permease